MSKEKVKTGIEELIVDRKVPVGMLYDDKKFNLQEWVFKKKAGYADIHMNDKFPNHSLGVKYFKKSEDVESLTLYKKMGKTWKKFKKIKQVNFRMDGTVQSVYFYNYNYFTMYLMKKDGLTTFRIKRRQYGFVDETQTKRMSNIIEV